MREIIESLKADITNIPQVISQEPPFKIKKKVDIKYSNISISYIGIFRKKRILQSLASTNNGSVKSSNVPVLNLVIMFFARMIRLIPDIDV